jgi:hypothetical protein
MSGLFGSDPEQSEGPMQLALILALIHALNRRSHHRLA